MRLDLSNSRICYLHFLIEIIVKQNVILNIQRHVELTNGIVQRSEGFRGQQFNRYKSIFILQPIRAVELMLFIMKDRNLIFLRLTTIKFNFSRISSVYCPQMRKCFIDFSHLTRGLIACRRYNFLNPKTPGSDIICNLSL